MWPSEAQSSRQFTAIIVFETPVVLINLIMDSGVISDENRMGQTNIFSLYFYQTPWS
jgi:hypothetical protein